MVWVVFYLVGDIFGFELNFVVGELFGDIVYKNESILVGLNFYETSEFKFNFEYFHGDVLRIKTCSLRSERK